MYFASHFKIENFYPTNFNDDDWTHTIFNELSVALDDFVLIMANHRTRARLYCILQPHKLESGEETGSGINQKAGLMSWSKYERHHSE